MNQFSSTCEISSALSSILLSGTNALDSIFAHLPPPVPSATIQPCLGSAVYLRQTELLRQFSSSQSRGSCSPHYAGGPRKKQYRGVRQRHWGKWVAEVRLPQSRMRVWLGTYDSPELAAYAYDRASYKLRGEYARLNFPDLRDATIDDCPERFRVLRTAVDAKIQAICERRRAKKLKREEIQQSESHSTEALSVGASSDSPSSSSSVTAEEEMGPEWSLAKIPSFDPELIWEVLAN